MFSPTFKVVISVNPKAGRCSPMLRAEELSGRLKEKGFSAELLTDLDEVTEKAKTFYAEGRLRAVVGVGGDGTAATLVNRTEPGTPVTLLAAGTANLLAKHFRLSNNPQHLAETIENGHLLTLDAGRADIAGTQRLFLVMVSCGFDADIVNGVHAHREKRYSQGHKRGAHISYFSYAKPLYRSLRHYRFPKLTVEMLEPEQKIIDDQARWAFFFNVNRYAWGLPLAPFAKANDGKLDHVLFRGGSIFYGFCYVGLAQCFSLHRFLPEAHPFLPTARLGQAARYRVTSDQPVPFQLDGDPGGILPLDIEIVPNRFTFLVPK
jgi:diacylglycerol kinase family enzyme